MQFHSRIGSAAAIVALARDHRNAGAQRRELAKTLKVAPAFVPHCDRAQNFLSNLK